MSFRLKTILGIALIEAVLLGLLLFSGLGFMASTAESEFVRRTEATARAFSVATKNALISSDLAELNAITREMLNYPGVAYARVRNAQGQPLAEAGEAVALAREPAPGGSLETLRDGLFDVVAEISEAGVPFGRVEVGVSATELRERSAEARRYGFGLAGLEMLLVAMFSWILGAYLTRQLRDLSEASTRLASGALGFQIPVRGRDELASTAVSFNRMSAQLAESYSALAARERDLRRVLANIVDAIFTLDANGAVMSASPAAERIFERGESVLRGTPLVMLFGPTSQAAVAEAIDRARRAPMTSPLLVEGLAHDGRPSWLELQLSRIEDATTPDARPAMLAVVRDVSERIESEKELRLRGRIIESTTVGTIIADATLPDLPVVDVNPAFEHITGYSAAEVRGRNCRFLQGPDTDPAGLQRIREALRDGTDVQVLLRNYRRDGQPFWNELRIMPIRDAGGRLTHFVALQSDVSDRIAAEQELARREAFLRQVLNTTHDGIIVIDESAIVESFNVGAEKMFGLSADEVTGRNVSIVVPEPHKSAHDTYLARYLATGETAIMGREREFEARHRDGGALWIALRVAEMQFAGQRRFIGVVHDITERKLAEIELRHAKEAAEEAANAKSEFLANMSHEIRTPMHGVLGSIEMMRETPLTGQQQRLLETATASASILLGVIDEILDFSRLEAGKLRLETLDFDVRRTVEDVTAMLGRRSHVKDVELACYIAPDVPETVSGDPIRLRQVLTNLVGNAIKFTERGEVVVTVTKMAEDEGAAKLRFEVRDTGIGIAREKQARLFEPFIQADSSTSRRYGGSGLGLSIARRLVELMHGHIGFESEEGVGSTFWFTLPARSPSGSSRGASGEELAGVRVLVVDDNSTNRIIMHRYLTSWGAHSSSAASGEEAMAKLQDAAVADRAYDVALLDLNMPAMDGYALVGAIQLDPALAEMPLIMLSSSMPDPARMRGLRVDVWLDKPVRQSDLHDAVTTVLKNRPARAQAPRPAHSRLPKFAGERVLLVEDNPITAEVGEEMLRRRGFAVEVAVDGHAAVAAVKRGAIDVVLMDIQLPGMDGYAATRAIRTWEAETGAGHMPIIALTAHALQADRERCIAAGMDDYVVKPYKSETLATVIARWLAPPNAEVAQAQEVLDPARVAEVRSVMGDAFDDLIGRVCTTLQQQLADLEEVYARGDAAAAREIVHRIKNTAGDVGAMRLHELATGLEQGLAADLPVMAAIAEFKSESQNAVAALGKLREKT